MLFTAVLAISICLLCPGLLFEIQSRALYVVDPENPLTSRQQKRPIAGSRNVEDCIQGGRCDRFNITAPDGVILDNYLCIPPKPRAIIIFFHGNAGSIYDRFPFASQLSRKTNSVVVMADYRGYGLNEGTPSENGLRLDAIGIIKKTAEYAMQCSEHDDLYEAFEHDENYEQEENEYVKFRLPILLHGHSLGAAVAIDIAACSRDDCGEVEIDAIVLSNPFTSIRDMILHLARKNFPSLFRPEGNCVQRIPYFVLNRVILPLFQRIHWDNAARVPNIKCTTWFIGAHNDNLVPVNHTHTLYDLSRSRKHKTIYFDVKHNNVHDSAGYYWDYNAFIDSILREREEPDLEVRVD